MKSLDVIKKKLGFAKQETADYPFFIIGCARSGTTLLRDLLRLHPRLECPEETHFFRWGDPYGTMRYERNYTQSRLIQDQQNMDGISNHEFLELLTSSTSKKEFAQRYYNLYLEKRGNPSGRWFDKTPQHVYGLLQISAFFPQARFVHIHRNPLNVVSSLLEGRVMPPQSLTAAISYWCEAVLMVNEYKKGWPWRVHEVAYEKLTRQPQATLKKLLAFLEEDLDALRVPSNYVHPEKDKYKSRLDAQSIFVIRRQCEPFFSRYGYAEHD